MTETSLADAPSDSVHNQIADSAELAQPNGESPISEFASALPRPRRRRLFSVRIPALLTGVMGLVNLWSSINPALSYRLALVANLVPLQARHSGRLAATLAGFALLLLAQSLWRRKYVAWGLTLGVLLLSAVAHLVKGLDYEEATCALALAAWLWTARRHFHARSDSPSVRHGVTVLVAAFVFTLMYGTLGLFFLDAHFRVHFGYRAAVVQTVTMFTQFYDPGLVPVTRFGRYFADSIYIVAAVTFGYALLMLARPVIQRHTITEDERSRVRRIVQQYGCTALAFCALFDDKIYWFSDGGSVVSYAVVGRVSVALGDPIGPLDDRGAAIKGFIAFCERNDWRPAFYEVYPQHIADYRSQGLSVLRIAHEAIVDLATFSMSGRDNKNVRNSVNWLTKAGYRCEMHEPPLSDELLGELRGISDEWLAMMHGGEKQFSLGWFQDDYVRSSRVMALHAPDNSITAFGNIVPEYELNESTIDLMRRSPDTAKGSMEFLFYSLIMWAKAEGFDTFNMGPSPFAGIGQHSDDPSTEKAIHFIYEHMDQFYNFKGLHAFKEKFRPRWRPLFLVYSGVAGLPATAAAIIRADSGQDTWLDFFRHLRGERPANAQ